MAGATLGFVHLSQSAVEAIIALSILFLALELIHEKKEKPTLTFKYPWLISFIFGLLHGFGFGGGLAEVGLPQHAITLALLFFNIGVELGQLIFVSIVVFLGYILLKYKIPFLQTYSKKIIIYTIGSLSSFWLIERLVSF
jgi:hydrogenase/urease accessory protein HupE